MGDTRVGGREGSGGEGGVASSRGEGRIDFLARHGIAILYVRRDRRAQSNALIIYGGRPPSVMMEIHLGWSELP